MRFYHGGSNPVSRIDPKRFGADGELLCASASVNVSMRYGDVVSAYELNDVEVIRCSVLEWFSYAGAASVSIPKIRTARPSVSAFIIEADPTCFDFLADTIFVVKPDALKFVGVLSKDEVERLDDGFSRTHEPTDRNARDWDVYVRDVCGGEDPTMSDADEQEQEPHLEMPRP